MNNVCGAFSKFDVVDTCAIVSEYFTRKQKEDLEEQQKINILPVITPAQSPTILPFVPPSIDFNDNDSPYYPDENMIGPVEQTIITTTISSIINPIDANVYDDNEEIITKNMNIIPTRIPVLFDPDESENQFSTPLMKRIHPDPKEHQTTKYLVVSWIPFAVIASCLFLSLVIAMITYIIYHKRRTASFKLVPQTAPII